MSQDLITVEQARALVLGATRPRPRERVEIARAHGRVLAAPVVAAGDTPPFPSSAMDGYAIQAGPAGRRLRIVGESRAGTPFPGAMQAPDAAIRISTGAAVPPGATAVIRQEDVTADPAEVLIHTETRTGQNIRERGEDLRAGAAVLSPGARLGAAELAAAVAAGAAHVEVGGRPRVAVLGTGDELREPGALLEPGEIHNSNGIMLAALAQQLGAQAAPPEHLLDDRDATERAIARALETSDVLLITGGVSVGPHDHVRPALARIGVAERFWGVALQPGKPTWFGERDEKLVFGLPGNPVSAFVTFWLFAAPALRALQGAPQPGRGNVTLARAIPRNRRRAQALRVRLTPGGAEPTGPQGSHVISSLLGAAGLAMIPPGDGVQDAGSTVAFEPLTP